MIQGYLQDARMFKERRGSGIYLTIRNVNRIMFKGCRDVSRVRRCVKDAGMSFVFNTYRVNCLRSRLRSRFKGTVLSHNLRFMTHVKVTV